MIALFTLVPAEVWAHPAVDQVYSGFDPNLIHASDGSSGSVTASRSVVDISAPSGSDPAVTLLTTPLQRIAVAVDVNIVRDEGAALPLRIGVWSPLSGTGYFVDFNPAPSRSITVDAITGGRPGTTLVGGHDVRSTTFGTYAPGTAYRIELLMDRAGSAISYRLFEGTALAGEDSVTRHTFPALFEPLRLSLTASSTAAIGSCQLELRNYRLTLLHERFWTSKVEDRRAQFLLVVLATAALAVIVIAAVQARRGVPAAAARLRAAVASVGARGTAVGLVIAGVALYLAGNAFLFRFAGHPFDMGGARVFAYVARTYGPAHLYFLPNAVPLAPIWTGVPNLEAGDPYGPVSTYLFAGAGWLHAALFGGGGTWGAGSMTLEAVLKSTNVLFGLGDAALIYLILGRIGLDRRWRVVATLLFAFNPAVWFSMSVWGQTHVISLFFVLAAVWCIEAGWVTAAWLGLVAACLTRPQMLVFALLLGIVLLRKFHWRVNLFALSWTVVVTFLVLVPLTIATSPSLPVDLVINNFRVQEAGGNDPSVTTVSQGAYSIWPLVTLTSGASGLARIYAPSMVGLIGPVTYQRASQVLTGVALLVLVWMLLRRRPQSLERGEYLPIVAAGICAFLMLLTGIVSTHFLLALPFLLLCRRWLSSGAYLFIALTWTVTTLVPMFGDMATILTSGNLLLSSPYDAATEFVMKTYSWDRFISAGVAANLCVLVVLAYVTVRRRSSRHAYQQEGG